MRYMVGQVLSVSYNILVVNIIHWPYNEREMDRILHDKSFTHELYVHLCICIVEKPLSLYCYGGGSF
ncbi:hypothetical protein GDO86_014008 [Hymenochirus boettgeri]|uniref:Uncharacterized protein n=1 Tax=Hymenochirus boettgeri TaxID=247094 RepID=A0A8T2JVK9_9PIPI|nr:hypothetical protein GDO86_014008 [Hymenochirus boettgeri]